MDEWINYYTTDVDDEVINSDVPNNLYSYSQIPPNFLNYKFQNARTPFTGLQEGIGSFKTNVGQKLGQGWEFAQQLPGMAMSALTGIPGVGFLMGMLPKTSPEQRNFMENIYSDPEYQNLLSQIPGAENLNPVYGLGSGRGLSGSLSRRLGTINRTLGRMTPQQLAQTSLKERKARIEELLQLERS